LCKDERKSIKTRIKNMKNTLNTSVSFFRLFQIWEAGKIEPLPYRGGDSSIVAGTPVIFCFKLPRMLSFGAVMILFHQQKADGEGDIVREGDLAEAEYYAGHPLRSEKYIEKEYYIFSPVPLEECKIYLQKKPPTSPEEWEEREPEISENILWFYSKEGQRKIKEFLAFCQTLKMWKE